MTARASIELATQPLERIPADLAVVGAASDERPLRGGAGRVDWRLCALLSELAIEGHLTGAVGEAILLPGTGRLNANRVLVLGVGPRAGRDAAAVTDLVATAMSRCLEFAARRVALAALGWDDDDWPRHAEPLIRGLDQALGAGEDGRELSLRLAVPAADAAPTLRALAEAHIGLPGRGASIALPSSLPASPPTPGPAPHDPFVRTPSGDRPAADHPISPSTSRP